MKDQDKNTTQTEELLLDVDERQDWLEAFHAFYRHSGKERTSELLHLLANQARDLTIQQPYSITTPYRNTIDVVDEISMPGDPNMENRIRSIVRWNAIAMVLRANKKDSNLGGHISTFSSIATLYDVGFNHFFRAANGEFGGDLVFFQGHSSPGVYARSFMEGRISAEQLDLFRSEAFTDKGLSSYPHPRLMPNYWQFPTVSMGLGPIQAIYQAHFMKYMTNRSLQVDDGRKVWCFIGDGETDEPESLGAISLAGREKLSNLIFVVNCNLQRLDGPVRGNGKIIQDLEGQFRGAGWQVIKLIWGSGWDPLLRNDTSGFLQKRMDEAVDGEYQNFKAKGGAYTRENFFGKYPESLRLVESLSDDDIYRLRRGGHDARKVYNAYHRAVQSVDGPTVILVKTVKGYGTSTGEAKNTTHSLKKMDDASLLAFRDRFNLPLSDKQTKDLEYYRPHDKSPEIEYMQERRLKLGGFLPARRSINKIAPIKLAADWYEKFTKNIERENSTTMVFVRLISTLLRDKNIGKLVVPIVPDEARTFGMEGLFKQIGIYTSEGQKYVPQDSDQISSYHETINGQILQEGISEPGAFSTWMAAATSGHHYDLSTIPFYIYYSIFGFQRIGDLAWAAGDLQARGFLLGATAGRTTLAGEGLQHDDGHSVILASTIPNCLTYDPAYAFELALIIDNGLKRMFVNMEPVYYYITLYNENYLHPGIDEVADKNVRENIVRGMYLFATPKKKHKINMHLLSSGSIFKEALAAAEMLEDYGIGCNIWSVTSFTELAREANRVTRQNALSDDKASIPFVTSCLQGEAPVLAVTDYVRHYAQQIAPFITNEFLALGTDGFGRSDTRENLRRFFEVDATHICYYALYVQKKLGNIDAKTLASSAKKLGIIDKPYSFDM